MGTVDYARLAKDLKPYLAAEIRTALNAALTKAALPTVGGGSGGSVTPPGGGTDVHALASTTALGTKHTVSGLTPGMVLRALSGTTAAFGVLQHGQLGGVGPNDHHNQSHAYDSSADHTGTLSWPKVNKTGASLADLPTRLYADLQSRTHDIVGGDHAISAAQWQVVGATATNVLGLLTPSSDVGAGTDALLRAAAGYVKLKNINVGDVLRSDTANGVMGVNVAPAGAALDIRAASAAHHTQRIKQIAGQTGRLWRIEDTSGQELIVLDSVGNLQSGNPGFVSGLTGWRVSPVGNAEFNNGRFRGELHASVFVFDEVNVRNGTDLITPAGGALALDATLSATGAPAIRNVRTTAFGDQDYLDYRTDSATGSGTGVTARTIENLIAIKNPDTGHYQVFRAGEVLRCKVWTGSGISDIWMRVNSAQDMGGYFAYFVQVMSGTLPVTLTAGAAVAGYGRTGEGAIRLSADDPYGPLIDIFTRGAAPWNGADLYPHVRLGRLDGVGLPGVSGITQWGMVAGANLADANSPYLVMSNLQQRMFKIASEWHDGVNTTARIEPNGRARFGTNVDSPANTFLDINPGTGLATFRGAVEVLSGTIPAGVVSGLGALAAANNLDDVPNGATYARVNSTIINGGNIRVGSGTKDVDLYGFNVDAGEIVGQANGVDQVVMGSGGKITGGAGAATMDENGFMVLASSFQKNTATYNIKNETGMYAGLAGYYLDDLPAFNLMDLFALPVGNRRPKVVVRANGNATYPGAVTISATATGTASVTVDGGGDVVQITAADIKHGSDKILSARTTAW